MASEIVSDHETDEISSVEVSDSSDTGGGIGEDEKGSFPYQFEPYLSSDDENTNNPTDTPPTAVEDVSDFYAGRMEDTDW